MAHVNNKILEKIALSVRTLSADAIRKANSGHPGLPLGMADLGALLFAEILNYDASNPKWLNRDRLVLSAGHGSMWLYSLLHLSGYNVSLSDIKKFRQFGSKTPGHPEYKHTEGVETTTGPLGAGFSNAVGMAMAERMVNKEFSSVVGNYTYVVAGDGCMMEGVTSEAASLAGHLGLGKLIVFYDSNSISIEGSTDIAFTESVQKRFSAYNWQVLKAQAHNFDSMRAAIAEAKKEKNQASLIICKSIIGKGSPTLQGTAATHGSPLPVAEISAMRKKLGVPKDKSFFIAPQAIEFFKKKQSQNKVAYKNWTKKVSAFRRKSRSNQRKWDEYVEKGITGISFPRYKVGDSLATRKANGACIDAISKKYDWFTGGSADLEPSNNTKMPSRKSFFAKVPQGRMLHYGVREHAMGGIVNGLTLYGMCSFGATFLVFADYMRPPLRLAGLMRIPSNFVFTHDSIFVGEDGPTHQPVEQVPSLRLIPNLRVFRPADAQESVLAWQIAISRKVDPNALLFTRQNITVFNKPKGWKDNASKGAYVVIKKGRASQKAKEIVIVATGSEVEPCLEAAKILSKTRRVRVVSMLCKELFDAQQDKWKTTLIPKNSTVVVVEAACSGTWDTLKPALHIGIEGFGTCGPAEALKKHYGLSGTAIAARIKKDTK